MVQIYFIRHGESEANHNGYIAGWLDSPLTEKGRETAEKVAQQLVADGLVFDSIYTSTLSRARETAEIIAKTIGYPLADIRLSEDLRERGFGDLSGRPKSEFLQLTSADVAAAGGESYKMLYDRVLRANQLIAADARAGKHILIVGHSGFYRMALVLSQGLMPEQFRDMRDAAPANTTLLPYPLIQ